MQSLAPTSNPIAPPTLPSAVSSDSDALREIQRDLLHAITNSGTKDTALAEVVRVTQRMIGSVSVFRYERDESQQLIMATRLTLPAGPPSKESWRTKLLSLADAACKQGRLQSDRLDDSEQLIAFAVPVFMRKRPPEAIIIVAKSTPTAHEIGLLVAPLIASHLTFWHVLQDSAHVESEAEKMAAVLELFTRLQGDDNLSHACLTLASEVQAYLRCDRVAVALCRGAKSECRMEALSGMAKFDNRSELIRAMEAAMDESVLRDSLTIWPTRDDSKRHATLAHQRLCSLTNCQSVVSSPLHDEAGDVVGAWLFFGEEGFAKKPGTIPFIRACQRPVGACLRLLEGCNASLITRAARLLQRSATSWRLKAAVFAAGIMAIILMLPMHYRISCDCQLQPVTRRFVAAPYEATLEKAERVPGDVVSKGDVLARIDGREIRWELAALVADRDAADKQRDSALAIHRTGEAQLAKLEMDRLDLKILLLQNRIEHLEIKSPLDGIVISGDLVKAEGAPLSTGQTLFEIAPLDEMIVEVAVAEDEIAYVKPGQEVDIRIDAYPGEFWRATIARVHPRAEIRDNESIFIAELTIANPENLLRPGMNGRAKIVGPRRLLAWNLFHRPWESFVQALGW